MRKYRPGVWDKITEDPDVRFDRHYVRGPGCWEWSGKAYFQMGSRLDGTRRKVVVSHYAWERWMGPLPAYLVVCHLCDNPRCVRPSHLWLGTRTENNRDRCFKGRCRHRNGHGAPHGRPPVKYAIGVDP